MYYNKTVDLTPEAGKRRSHEIPGNDANTLTEVGNQRLYKNATIKTTLLEEISSMYYSKDQVNVFPALIHYKGVNGVLETQEPCGAAR